MDSMKVIRSLRVRRSFIVSLTAVLLIWSAVAEWPSFASGSGADFALSVTPAGATVAAGSSTRYGLTVTSEHGLAGTVNVGITNVSPNVRNGPTFHLSRYDIWVSPTSPTGPATITASTTSGTPATTYTVTVTGKVITSGPNYGLTHSTTFTLTVQ